MKIHINLIVLKKIKIKDYLKAKLMKLKTLKFLKIQKFNKLVNPSHLKNIFKLAKKFLKNKIWSLTTHSRN